MYSTVAASSVRLFVSVSSSGDTSSTKVCSIYGVPSVLGTLCVQYCVHHTHYHMHLLWPQAKLLHSSTCIRNVPYVR